MMSKIKYRLSDLISQECIDELSEMQDEITNCGNDKLIIETDLILRNTAILDLIKIIHTSNNSDANKALYVQHPMKKW
ncbi:hypothetical protein J6I39_02940 [bacterium]|nr:hypothetical protein [bacterium]